MKQGTSSLMPITAGALLFDMDGLLVDSEPLWAEVEMAFAARRGADFTPEMARQNKGHGIRHTVTFMNSQFGFGLDVEEGVRALIDAFLASTDRLVLKPFAEEVLRTAHGEVPMALASSSHRSLVDASVRRFGLDRWMSATISGQDAARPKPAPDVFLAAAMKLGVAPERCVVLEDSVAGVRAGSEAGMFVIAIPEGLAEDPALAAGFERANVVVPSLREAAQVLGLALVG